jgi:plastocyanin
MRRQLVASIALLSLVVAACGTEVSGAQTFRIGVDAASPEGKNLQYSTFFPSTLKASAGDSIVFTNASSQAPHTITFGVEADRSNQPPVVLPNGTESPVVTAPCFAEAGSTAKLTTCPTKTLPAYEGSGYWNSGFLVPAVAPEGPKEVTLELADSIEPGQYRYLCVLHGPMAGVVEVVEEGDREATDAVTETADEQLVEVRAEADGIADPEVGANAVAAGWSGGVTAVNRFLPETIEVKAGSTVTWDAFSDYEPHTVSFGPNFKAGVPGPGQAPSGPKSGAAYTGGEASSGMFGKPGGPFPPGPYKLSFPNAGTYAYVCVLHPAMVGTVKVT